MALLAALAVASAGGIYPEGHFDRVTKVTTSTADEFVTKSVDAGKTVFLRWIASEG